MGLFDKKYCDVCGEKIGLLGNRKLEDGNLCKSCAAKLSPWFSDRRDSTVAEIKEQLAYREANAGKVATFNVTRTLDGATQVLLDEDGKQLIVASDAHWRDENPDVVDFSQITGCVSSMEERREEIMGKDSNGMPESYDPPRYETTYDVYVTINVNTPYFDEMRFPVSSESSKRASAEYADATKRATEMCTVLEQLRQGVRDAAAEANAAKQAVTCPHCGATVVPDEHNCCEFCGGALT